MSDSKEILRRRITTCLKTLGAAERFRRSALAVQRLLESPLFAAARAVAAYPSVDPEVDTAGLLAQCLAAGKRLALPRTDRATCAMNFHLVTNLQSDLEARHFKFHEPLSTLPILSPEDIDLIVVPGLAFDAKGNRLGRGAGYYDRFLAQPDMKARSVSLAFDCQIVESVPTLCHDCGVDAIFTESRETVCNKA